jgi:hypothetical protein
MFKNYNSISSDSTSKHFRHTAAPRTQSLRAMIIMFATVMLLLVVLFQLDFRSSSEMSSSPIISDIDQTDTSSQCASYEDSCTLGEHGTCPICTASIASNQRIRQNIFSLTPDSYSKLVNAMWTMKTLSMEDGQAKYGKSFRTYDYLLAKHVAHHNDKRGDRSHATIIFTIWHACLELEYENSVLAIDPSIGAVSYWNWNESDKNAFNDMYFGSAPGTGSNYEVIDGPFANWPVSDLTEEIWTEKYAIYISDPSGIDYIGDTKSGKFRETESCTTQDHLVRYGEWNKNGTGPVDCTRHGLYPLYAFYYCLDFDYPSDYEKYHLSAHISIGGSRLRDRKSCPGGDNGDINCVGNSINDPVFLFHHINMDRAFHTWQKNNVDSADCYYGFTYNGYCFYADGERDDHCVGLGLNDTLSDLWGFTDEDLGLYIHDDPKTLWKVYEAMCYLAFNTAPYTYDDLS